MEQTAGSIREVVVNLLVNGACNKRQPGSGRPAVTGVARVVSAVDAGRILNQKTARSQIIGGTVGGIGMALLEETATDSTGRRIRSLPITIDKLL